MSYDPSRPQQFEADDALPPVEPPTPGFILQLFVVPGVIVVVVVMIWVMFNWLAQKGNDRDAFVRALSRNNEARWQAAFNLATALRAEHGASDPKLSNDPELAKQLAEILDREITAGESENHSVELRIYLSRALGEFRTPEGLPTLMRAATTQRNDGEAVVRRAAIEGIALAADNATDKQPFVDNPKLAELLLDASKDDDPRTRAVAVVAMGVIASPPLVERLRSLLTDAYPDVRYNAAARLANLGDATAAEVLVEMLDPDEQAGVNAEKQKDLRPFKRSVITINALRAVGQLAQKNSAADLSALTKSIESLLASGSLDPETRLTATETLQTLRARKASAE